MVESTGLSMGAVTRRRFLVGGAVAVCRL